MPNSSKSTESLYSSTSSKYTVSAIYSRTSNNIPPGRKNKNAGANSTSKTNMTTASRSSTGEIRQRVLSARRLRMKTLQNQLADAQLHIAELAHENRVLRTLHKRQDNALLKYESTSAELPQLLHSHAEEIRAWQTKCKNLQIQNRELANKLKQKDQMILNISDQNKHLTKLNNDKNLEDRERLTEKVRFLEQQLNEKDNDLKLMARKLQLEKKSFKYQLNSEHSKYKDLLHRIEKTNTELKGIRVDPMGIAEKLAKLSILPKDIKGGTAAIGLNSLKNFHNKVEGSDSQREFDIYEEEIETKSIMQKNNELSPPISSYHDSKTTINGKVNQNLRNHELQNDSPSPKSDINNDFNTPSPVTIRRKSTFDKRASFDEYTAEGMSLKEYEEVTKFSDKISSSDKYSKWKSGHNNTIGKVDSYNEEYIYKTTFEDDSDENGYHNGHLSDKSNDEVNENDGSDENYSDRQEVEEVEPDNDYNNSIKDESTKDFTNIKKQIMTDYQNREQLLDAFCRDSSINILNPVTEQPNINQQVKNKSNNVDTKKKTKLLAALRAIDEIDSKDLNSAYQLD